MKTTLGRLAALGALVTLATLNVGCLEIGAVLAIANGTGDSAFDDGDSWGAGTFDVRAVSLSGSLGDVERFDDGVWLESGMQYGDVATIELQSKNQAEGWAVMTALDIEGGLDHPDLVPGAVLTFRQDDAWSGAPGALYVSLLGCSGPETGYWDFDRHADEVVVVVEEGSTPNQRRIDYTGTWDDGSTVNGSVEFDYQ